ncbi:sialic acid-binding Ig-like lectin 11 isoform X2 [Heterocephalus glaber]|uniref:Sialic acid-binding Ig-like lectin 11 isoform X2 n=1 Tax=Heterocephalus glaber TaxID=10181 RepID=A0AAX6Q7G9_HETGA|nr:sialic acid-binding Ig-like lectin 11 isoform X2 [Heterocephalus glaber]
MLLLALLLPLLWAGSLQEEPSYWLRVQKLVTVQETLCALVSCSFSYPQDRWNHSTPAYGYWYQHKEGPKTHHTTNELVATNDPRKKAGLRSKARFQLLGDPRAYNCSLRIAELTQTPDIHMPELLVSGHSSRLECSMPGACSGALAPTFFWTGAALRPSGWGLGIHRSSEILLTPLPQDHGTHLTCRVTLPQAGVTRERTVQLSVSYPPQSLTLSVSTADDRAPDTQGNGSYLEAQKGQFLRLLCAADSRPPATLTWDLEARVLAQSQTSGRRPLRLELPGVKPGDAGRYTCRAENRLGSQHSTLELSVQYPPEDLRVTVSQANRTVLEILGNGSSLPVLEGQSLRLVCVTHSSPPARLSWARGTQPLSPSWPSAPGVLELPRVQMEHEGEVSCHAENPLGTRSVSLSLSVHYAPQLLGPWCSWEAEGLRCSCFSCARPVPSLRWRLGEALLEGNSSNASLMVTSSWAGPWANSSLSFPGGLSSGDRLSCEAGNVHGVQRATVLLLPGKPESWGGYVLAALGGAAASALLSLCACLLFSRMKTPQKEAVRTVATEKGASCGPTPVCWGHLNASGSDHPSSAMATTGEEQGLHYASLSFLGLKPRKPQNQKDSSTTECSSLDAAFSLLQATRESPGQSCFLDLTYVFQSLFD